MSGPQISDHALLRFIERAGGMGVEPLRNNLSLSLRRAHDAARALGQSDYLIKIDGLTYVVRGETVTTVLDTGHPGKEAHALGRKDA